MSRAESRIEYGSLISKISSYFSESLAQRDENFVGVFFRPPLVYTIRMVIVQNPFMNSEEGERGALAEALRGRDPELLEQLINQYYYRLFRYLIYLTGNREIAEDLFQETWVRVLKCGHQYDGRSKFDTWLFTISRHLVIDRLRSKKAQVSLEEWSDSNEPGSGRTFEATEASSPFEQNQSILDDERPTHSDPALHPWLRRARPNSINEQG